MNPLLLRTAGVLGACSAGGYAYAMAEARSYRLRRLDVPVLAPGERPMRVLHVSDLHLLPQQAKKIAWVRRLAELEPDLVVNTGDNLAGFSSVPAVLDALGPLLRRPGLYVFGSNDYIAPTLRNPLNYFLPNGSAHKLTRAEDWTGDELPWQDLRAGFDAAGWRGLSNTRTSLTVDGRSVDVAGVDDPHIKRDRYEPGPLDDRADLTLGVMHAPYQRVLDAMGHDGARLLLAGHTHGGQLRVPGSPAALVTNCDLPRGQARGLSRWGAAWLHVSAGLGTSPYFRIRVACPPEATLLTLMPREA